MGVGAGVVVGLGVDVGVAVGLGVAVGDGVGVGSGVAVADGEASGVGLGVELGPPSKEILTTAPDDDVLTVVIDTPRAGSVNVWPTARGASTNVVVPGFVSINCDWERVVYPGVIRMVTPLATGAVLENVSNEVPYG